MTATVEPAGAADTARATGAGRGVPATSARGDRLGVLGEIAERRRADLARVLGEPEERALLDAARTRSGRVASDESGHALAGFLRPGLHLIAELKRQSPSAGALAEPDADLVTRARAYESGGAAAISVLVEPRWFGGSLDDLRAVRPAVSVPLLAKEFVVDPRQLVPIRDAGADHVLLLAALHAPAALRRLVRQARSLGLEPLVEAHDERELERALASDARLVGLNNRDLRTLEVDTERAVRMRALVPDDRLVVAESGVREPATLVAWRALGFDAALVGEALMRAGTDPRAIRARVAAFVAAGRAPSADEDLAAADRAPWVKICGVTDAAGARAAVAAGADAIGLNAVPGTRRCLAREELRALAAEIRALRGGAATPLIVGVVGDADFGDVRHLAAEAGLEAIQWSGRAGVPDVAPRPAIAVLRGETDDGAALERGQAAAAEAEASSAPPAVEAAAVPTRTADADGRGLAVSTLVGRARELLARSGVERVIVDAADPAALGGTGARVGTSLAAAVAREVPIVLAGGLTAANVAGALRSVPAVGVDVSSGVERADAARQPARRGTVPRPRKDPYLVALFVKRAKAARLDLPQVPSRPTPIDPGLLDADARGRWGTARQFGGRYVPETLVAALDELERAWYALREDPRYWADLRLLLRDYVGRPSPLYRADRLAAELERRGGREPGRLRLYLKREDLNHTGAHKITNALGQALLTRRLGKSRVIAETGAGQHGVATATACALLGLPCTVFMGREDIRRQAPNVLRMRALGAEVREVTSGSGTLKDATNEAMRAWVTDVRTTHYVLGSAVGPHPYPTVVRDLQRVIGDEAAAQVGRIEGRLPDAVVACVGGGSNAIGLFSRFLGEPFVRIVAVEAAGEGIASGRHAAALAGGSPGVLHGSRSYLLQDADGQVQEAISLSAGLDYPGIGPQLSALYEGGRLEILDATDVEALDALRLLTRTEGIIPALEPAHAIAALPVLLGAQRTEPGRRGPLRTEPGRRGASPLPPDALVVLGLSGRGDKDMGALEDGEVPA